MGLNWAYFKVAFAAFLAWRITSADPCATVGPNLIFLNIYPVPRRMVKQRIVGLRGRVSNTDKALMFFSYLFPRPHTFLPTMLVPDTTVHHGPGNSGLRGFSDSGGILHV